MPEGSNILLSFVINTLSKVLVEESTLMMALLNVNMNPPCSVKEHN